MARRSKAETAVMPRTQCRRAWPRRWDHLAWDQRLTDRHTVQRQQESHRWQRVQPEATEQRKELRVLQHITGQVKLEDKRRMLNMLSQHKVFRERKFHNIHGKLMYDLTKEYTRRRCMGVGGHPIWPTDMGDTEWHLEGHPWGIMEEWEDPGRHPQALDRR